MGGQFPATPLRAAALPAGAIGCPLPGAGAGQWLNAHAATLGHTARGIPTQAASSSHPEHRRRRWLAPRLKVKVLVSLGCFGITWSANGNVWGQGL